MKTKKSLVVKTNQSSIAGSISTCSKTYHKMGANVTLQIKKMSSILVTSGSMDHWIQNPLESESLKLCRKNIKNKLDCFKRFKKLILTKKINSPIFATYLPTSLITKASNKRLLNQATTYQAILESCTKIVCLARRKVSLASSTVHLFNYTVRRVLLLLRNLYFVNNKIFKI